ncbi:NAD(P)-binding domain-containing protein [Streptomyces sp. B-S-A8]|uniref:NAD(P)-binding domain-containing protein n=1 Tax=Streptomyces solicavernae TaxID=3043614 RepID=A0ABT6RVU3_9ACTN|nr:NAD(P)-binding domain-containing protein [Streptomyces sp. B-S-A8]MDI3388543.1 NAD(P)-binding domain-containing protein [Streptomyces sp. B-S-A8]
MTDIAWIGLGTMGLPMARNLVSAGHRVLGVDVVPEARREAAGQGIEVVDSVAKAVATAETVFTMLPSGGHVRAVFLGDDGILAHVRKGALVVDTSTVDVATSRWCHERAAEHAIDFVDSPVSGGVPGAERGTLTWMMGGRATAKQRLRETAAPMAAEIIDVGDATAGIAAKICNNLMLFINMMAVAEGSQLAGHLGLDQRAFWEIASVSSSRSWALENWYPVPGVVPSAPASHGFAPSFPVTGAFKDVQLALQAGHDLDLAGANLVAERLQALIDEGLGDRDCTLIAKLSSPHA